MILTGVSDAEFNDIANYYARQPAERAKTLLVGDPAAGRGAIALCASCHGEQGISIVPSWPNLAGQDARYLADATRAYAHGARNKVIACSACHGEGGISRLSGIPSLAGLDPQYLVPAMRAYATGDRKHGLKKVLMTGLNDSELSSIASFYARQTPGRAQTPAVGNASAGKASSALCANCHGEAGVSQAPVWPSLAGQDARYLADATRAYKQGKRNKVVACAACHGEGGVSRQPGTPSLVGLSPAYLVAAMKSYVDGKRTHDLMKALLVGVSDAELNEIALYYARQSPVRAPTPAIGDVSAGKAASAGCAGCHGAQGVSPNPAWPSLAGQDAQFLAAAIRSYKEGGSRNDTMKRGIVAALDDRTINDVASYFASLRPERPSGVQPGPTGREPVLIRNGLVGSLDEHAIDDVATYYASLRPERPMTVPAGPPGREPLVVGNGLVAGLSDRTINDVASYYATLRPVQPRGAGRAQSARVPALINTHAPPDGRSVGGIISFRKDDPGRRVEDNNAICLGCHERGERTYWHGSTHETRAVACTECHTVMRQVSAKASLKNRIEMETCFQCHQEQRAKIFRSAHMPLREGRMTCSNCHNPHGTATEAMLRESSTNDTCYKCHAEKRGPFLFEHAPVRENCLSCHDPHGSNNEYMLKVSRPRLCFECHGFGHGSLSSGSKAVETVGRACQNCHTAVHGSNSPSGPLLHR